MENTPLTAWPGFGKRVPRMGPATPQGLIKYQYKIILSDLVNKNPISLEMLNLITVSRTKKKRDPLCRFCCVENKSPTGDGGGMESAFPPKQPPCWNPSFPPPTLSSHPFPCVGLHHVKGKCMLSQQWILFATRGREKKTEKRCDPFKSYFLSIFIQCVPMRRDLCIDVKPKFALRSWVFPTI